EACGYGVMDKDARPTPLFHAKKLCAQYVRYGDRISFPEWERDGSALDAVVAHGDGGRRSALLVHKKEGTATYPLADRAGGLEDCRALLKIDGGTGGGVVRAACDGTVTFAGYGVAVVTNAVLSRDGEGT